MITIHLIPQAHLDPVWLWPWSAGLDEAIATCHTVCDLLERHPDMTFNMGDAWILEQVEQTDPDTFGRIRKAVEKGRWDLSGGWFIQPDCNFPLGSSITRQIEMGHAYLMDRFGQKPRIALNVDSFGHAAALPTLMQRSGQNCYVMMRPQEHEMDLPARLFNWSDPATGARVTTFRIADAYCTPQRMDLAHVSKSLTDLPPGVEHTMCFLGVGDHGGGPTEAMLDWCRQHRKAVDGAVMKFSTPVRFFEAIAGQIESLPLVEGELQYHAIGCYSVEGRLKRAARRAEHQLLRAERALALDPAPPAGAQQRMAESWRSVCFHQFHDTIGGTCLPSAYRFVHDDIGGAAAEGERVSAYALRRMMLTRLGSDALQRIVLFNPSDQPFDGYIEFEPWCEFTPWQPHWNLVDDAGRPVPFQRIAGEAQAGPIDRLLFRFTLAADELYAVRIDRNRVRPLATVQNVTVSADRLSNDAGVAIIHDNLTVRALAFANDASDIQAPMLALVDDPSDTWSHRIDRYVSAPQMRPVWSAFGIVDKGPLMASCVQEGRIGESDVLCEWRVYADMPFIDLMLRVHWRERRKVLKLFWPVVDPTSSRLDGTLGGSTARSMDGREYPLQDWMLLRNTAGDGQAIVCPDTFAADADSHAIRLTLLRSPLLAHHEPNHGTSPRGHYSDRGEHVLRFRFFRGPALEPGTMVRHANTLHNPPLTADLTRGMPARRVRGDIA